MHSPITPYGTNVKITDDVSYRADSEMEHGRHGQMYTLLVELSSLNNGSIPTELIRRYGKLYETYCNVCTSDSERRAIERAVRASIASLTTDSASEEPLLDAA